MAFATAEDVATRLGRALTDAEQSLADLLVEVATAVIVDAASKTDAWADALDPVPRMLRFLAIELAYRVMSNPEGLRSLSEQLGSYQSSRSFRDTAAGGGMLLTDVEEALVRRTVYGSTSGSATVASVVDDLPLIDPYYYFDCLGS